MKWFPFEIKGCISDVKPSRLFKHKKKTSLKDCQVTKGVLNLSCRKYLNRCKSNATADIQLLYEVS